MSRAAAASRVSTRQGRDAAAPHQIPARGWAAVLRRTGGRVLSERLPLLAAGIAFFALLSIAPVLLTALSVYGAVVTPEQALEQFSDVVELLPEQLQSLVASQFAVLTANSTKVLTVRGAVALLVALWTATAAAGNLIGALTVAYHEEETRSGLHRVGLALLGVLGGALVLGGVLAAAGVLTRLLSDSSGTVRHAGTALTWVAVAVLVVVGLDVVYRYGPDRERARWHWTSWGSMGAAVVWLGTSFALFTYVRTAGLYDVTYGSLAGVAISMLWVWITVLLVLVGAVLNAETERQTTRDSTVGPEAPRGQRGAVVADDAPPPDGGDPR